MLDVADHVLELDGCVLDAELLPQSLLHLAESAALHAVPGSAIELHVSQRELGNIAGGSRESVNKILQSWHKAGWITLGKGTIAIRDLAAIERIAKLGPPLR